MAAEGPSSKGPVGASTLEDSLEEEGHYFDFIRFYKKVEFCDRSIRLEILEEGRKEIESPNCEEIPVNSIVVAAKNVVLQKMLSTEMQEANKSTPVVIKVTTEEKTAFKEMLHFLYAGSLSPRLLDATADVRELLALLVLGDKFEVPSLMGAVVRCISARPRRIPDSSVLATEIPDTLLQVRQVKSLANEARAHIVETYADVSGTWASEEFMSLSLEVIEILMQSEELEAESEEEIVEKLLGWIRRKYDTLNTRRRMLTFLSPHIRFFCLTGEALESFLSVSEMQSKVTQNTIREAVRFQSYSEHKKVELQKVASQRKGVRDVHLEIVSDFSLDENGTWVRSRSSLWFGKRWFVELSKSKGGKLPLDHVTIILSCKKVPEIPGSVRCSTVDRLQISIYVKIWPEGFWKFLQKTVPQEFNLEAEKGTRSVGFGALSMSWADARKSERLVGRNGAISIKVVARRFQHAT